MDPKYQAQDADQLPGRELGGIWKGFWAGDGSRSVWVTVDGQHAPRCVPGSTEDLGIGMTFVLAHV